MCTTGQLRPGARMYHHRMESTTYSICIIRSKEGHPINDDRCHESQEAEATCAHQSIKFLSGNHIWWFHALLTLKRLSPTRKTVSRRLANPWIRSMSGNCSSIPIRVVVQEFACGTACQSEGAGEEIPQFCKCGNAGLQERLPNWIYGFSRLKWFSMSS